MTKLPSGILVPDRVADELKRRDEKYDSWRRNYAAVVFVVTMIALLWTIKSAHADEESCKAARETASSERVWHLLTVTNGGVVTLLKDLTHKEAEFARARVLNEPATVEECEEAQAKRLEELRLEDLQRKDDEARVRAKAPKCPVGAKRGSIEVGPIWDAWNKVHANDPNIELSRSLDCDGYRSASACILENGSIDWMSMGYGLCYKDLVDPNEFARKIKSAEVFK